MTAKVVWSIQIHEFYLVLKFDPYCTLVLVLLENKILRVTRALMPISVATSKATSIVSFCLSGDC